MRALWFCCFAPQTARHTRVDSVAGSGCKHCLSVSLQSVQHILRSCDASVMSASSQSVSQYDRALLECAACGLASENSLTSGAVHFKRWKREGQADFLVLLTRKLGTAKEQHYLGIYTALPDRNKLLQAYALPFGKVRVFRAGLARRPTSLAPGGQHPAFALLVQLRLLVCAMRVAAMLRSGLCSAWCTSFTCAALTTLASHRLPIQVELAFAMRLTTEGLAT